MLQSSFVGPLGSIIGMLLGSWWCFRQYYCARGKGYYPALAATIVFGAFIATFSVELTGAVLLGSETWSETASNTLMILLFPVAALVVTALVALLPRPSRIGPRMPWLLSWTGRVLEVGLLAAAAGCAIASFVLFAAADLSTSTSFSAQLSQTLGYLSLFAVLGASALRFARQRLNAPGLLETLAADTRPPVLYLRAFRQESEPFAYLPPTETPRYTHRGVPTAAVTFEQYFSAEFARQLGPLVALGNPFDPVPPEGAARRYALDAEWQQHFSTYAAVAAAIVIDGSFSSNLYWELTEITGCGWQRKLFFLTAPAPPRRSRTLLRLRDAVRRSVKGIRASNWNQLSIVLANVGLHMPMLELGPGMVITFDASGRAKELIRDAQKPEEYVAAIRTRL